METDQGFELVRIIQAATRIVAARVLSVISLLMIFGLTCWAMVVQTILSSCIAGGFAVLVFLPVLYGERRRGE
jgi:hypothetical protein